MNTVVNKLLDVDKQARIILDEAQQYYDRTIEDIEAEKQRITADYQSKANAHYKRIEETEQAAIVDAVKETDEKYARLTAAIDEAFERGRAGWENELFERCVKAVGE